ncbi:winged helix-turn-helix transcriptional regulator [Amycolatopsis sp. NPDC059027]|uniref:winged helix-turn-helix transcriptional regulator n=1 Tax=unclassified Amycolatopsis TaxID=2618356 RepID=UPI00366D9A29
MTTRTYGQFCGLARALEIIGERWALLVVRDLMLGPKRFTDLQHTLPKIPTSLLSARLNELEQSGVVRRKVLPQLDAGVVYELTEYGSELDQIVLELGLWGARSLGHPGPEQVFTLDSAILSLYTTFNPEAAAGVHITFEVRHPDDMIVHAIVDDGTVKAGEGSHPGADLVITPQGPVFIDVLTGQLRATDALQCGAVHIDGEPQHFELFTRLFRIPAPPDLPEGLSVR